LTNDVLSMQSFIYIILLLVQLFFTTSLVSQAQSIDFPTLDSLQANAPRDAVFFLHTDWCKYSKRMEKSTLINEEVMRLLADQFYFVSFNAEQEETVTFAGRDFQYLPQGRNTGVHELAMLLGQDETGKISYPTLVVLSPEREIRFQSGGYLSAKELVSVLNA